MMVDTKCEKRDKHDKCDKCDKCDKRDNCDKYDPWDSVGLLLDPLGPSRPINLSPETLCGPGNLLAYPLTPWE